MRKWPSWSLLLVFVIGIAGGAVGCAKLTQQGVNSDPSSLTQGVSTGLTSHAAVNTATNQGVPPAAGDIGQSSDNQQVIADFKENIMDMFRAWKAADSNEFRNVISLGFNGDLLESKVQEAESVREEAVQAGSDEYGAEVTPVNFIQVQLVKSEGNKATIDAQISYGGYAYDPVAGTRGDPFGTKTLHNQYTLELKNGHWYITGETPSNQ